MKQFFSVDDIADPGLLVEQALRWKHLDERRTTEAAGRCLGLLFFNPSLRTRLSSIRAAQHLGLTYFDQNVATSWPLEFGKDTIMNGNTSEHIEEAAAVLSQYCDVLAIRAFPKLKDPEEDAAEPILTAFHRHSSVPIINLESATRHPLQGFADMMTIAEHSKFSRPKVVLTWAPHPKALPQSVANSFVSWCARMGHDLTICHPPGYELDPHLTAGLPVVYDQREALDQADFVYAKNWSSFSKYGEVLSQDPDWTIDSTKMSLTNHGKFMHCLPVRRNVVVSSEVLRSSSSLVIAQANNRTFAAYAILRTLLQDS